MNSIQINYLADHPECAAPLAAWHHAEWAEHYPDWSVEKALAELNAHTGRCQVPTTLVALEGQTLIGSVSLLTADLDGWNHLTPWLASLFVIPIRRKQGLGKLLVDRAIEEAIALGSSALYLWTRRLKSYYEGMGWQCVTATRHLGRDIFILRRDLRP